jgi:3-phosphoglycerate kinase
MNYIDSISDLTGKKVVLRTDFDVPVGDNNIIGEEFRITRQRATVQYLLSHGARVLLVAHISAVPSFEPLKPQLQRLLGAQMTFCRDFDQARDFWNDEGSLALLENVRTNPGEKDNDAAFAGQLVAGADLYVNNAFAVCHREHASVASAPLMVPSYAGILLREETEQLSRVLAAPAQGKVVFMGGAKASTKVPVVRRMIVNAEHVAVGGVLANDIFKELGYDIGDSRVDDDAHELLTGLDLHDPRLVLPTDSVKDGTQIMDMGPESAKAFAALAAGAKLIVWNGPVGKFEDARFMPGTEAIAHAIAESPATSVIGGGDTIAAVNQLGLLDHYDFVSTGGGAMLAFLAGEQLPGLKALGYSHD